MGTLNSFIAAVCAHDNIESYPAYNQLVMRAAAKIPEATQKCLAAARVSLIQIQLNVQSHRIDTMKLRMAQPLSPEYNIRATIAKEMEAISENLGAISDVETKIRFPRVFADAETLRLQRNILAHRYGHGTETVEWSDVMDVIQNSLPSLKSALDKALEGQSD